ncbi:MAG: outer membrane beta-barrel protein [Xanthobacteraceae bacterium]
MRVAGLCGLGLLALTTSSFAADLPILRGSVAPLLGYPVYHRWDGVYLGGHGSYSAASSDFAAGTGDLVAFILRNTTIENEAHVSEWTTLSKSSTSGPGFGGFIGYNGQWDDAVVGLELNYSSVDLLMDTSDRLGRSYQTSSNYLYNVVVDGSASVRLTDIGSLRLRGGWAAYSFMPYAFVGLAVARADVTREATVDATAIDVSGLNRPNLALRETRTDNRDGVFAYGFAVGGGIDYAVLPNVFLRAEYEYLGFSDVADMKVNVNTVRAGAGVKF